MLQEKDALLQQERLLIIYIIAVLVFFIIFVIFFVVAFVRKKNKFIRDRYEAKINYENELANSKIEIQEQTFKNIAWELHDNVGQLLSVANIQLNILMHSAPTEYHEQIQETKNVVSDAVQEIRSLSKVLNTEVILKNGLIKSIEVELNRYNKLNYLRASLEIKGPIIPISSASEIIIFRILQEFFSNVIKHAKASKLFVVLVYAEKFLQISAVDDGKGFNTFEISDGSGLTTMNSRASLLKAEFAISSEIGKGTELTLKYPYRNA